MNTPIPIFVFTCDRTSVLQQSLASYKRIRPEPIIVIHDNGSTFPPMLDYLRGLERDGVQVFRSGPVKGDADLNRIAETIEAWFRSNDAPYYIVTDPDIAIEDGYEDMLDVYAHFLTAIPQLAVVGPMLRIDDIPDHYPLKFVAAGRHYYQFWCKEPLEAPVNGKTVRYQHATIDTTFGMYRRGFSFHRYNDGIRVYAPYWAKHLDWYIDPKHMSDDQLYYMERASVVSHWGGAWLRDNLNTSYVL
jgi:hypothetical protein